MLVRAVRARVVLVILGLKSGDNVHGRYNCGRYGDWV